ncbi:hypothetical protein [Rhizobium jaguaris]|uniref:Uncharacterized protein n=1 Tax=Rhizobium jaguaris TaxID=1312183 RepID=A0A387G8X6_9HYPH|nr:hypothetical protein CCGE525_34720 [Rhizobium jaguaris]
MLYFTGDPAQRAEADDGAIVLPKILQAFQGLLLRPVVSCTGTSRSRAAA